MGLSARARAWTALTLPAAAWFSFQQGLGWTLRVDCGSAWIGIGWGAASLLIIAGAASLAWRQVRPRVLLVHPWLARLALLGCVVFALATAFQTLAVAMVPPCAR